ncbi:MAG: LysR family transcriptional regulator [Lachnospiraceae bacterium]|nr:LysR family transcriptional regulator [Lachnospiraceae bacterium]
MKFENMREFIILESTRNYLEAAEQLYTSQASLSRHIKAMEEELGGLLFVRSTRKVELTPLGACILPYAKKAVALQEEYQEAVRRELELLNTTLVIGVLRRWKEYAIPELFMRYARADNQAKIDIRVASISKLKEMLYDGTCNFAFVRECVCESDEDFIRIPYYGDEVWVYFPEKHPLAHRDYVTISELKNERFILPDEESVAYELCLQVCHDADFEPNFVFRNIDGESIMDFVGRGLGIVMLPYNSVPDVPGIHAVKLEPDICSYVNLIYPNRPLKKAETSFLDYVT